jgi:hypothetical protein
VRNWPPPISGVVRNRRACNQKNIWVALRRPQGPSSGLGQRQHRRREARPPAPLAEQPLDLATNRNPLGDGELVGGNRASSRGTEMELSGSFLLESPWHSLISRLGIGRMIRAIQIVMDHTGDTRHTSIQKTRRHWRRRKSDSKSSQGLASLRLSGPLRRGLQSSIIRSER